MDGPTSPCINKCCLTENDICMGCFRSLSEIMEWSQASVTRKQSIIINAQERADGAANKSLS
jgi:predicted Fe-S protein YdhL (DUF1289 family)